MTSSLFNVDPKTKQPLAARMRPRQLSEFIGQEHILSPELPLYQLIIQGKIHSMIFWGPSGVGKTTLARLICEHADMELESISAVLSGVKEIRSAIARAKERQTQGGRKTLLFVDEVHRFNKSQQDAFLPHIEDGTLVFIGATTENPSFEVNRALLSRVKIYDLKPLEIKHLEKIIHRALVSPLGLEGQNLQLEAKAKSLLISAASGDARKVLNLLEICAGTQEGDRPLDVDQIKPLLRAHQQFDKQGDIFYEHLSAFHKSVRGSNPDAALYWMARMVDAGADPLILARRLLAIASEDIGNADPRALTLCISAWDTFTRLGGDDGLRAIAQACVYCACAPKSNAVYKAWSLAMKDAKQTGNLAVPDHLCNAPTTLMAQMGKGQGYRYAHNEPNAYASGQTYLPEQLSSSIYYEPTQRGLEARIKEKLVYLRSLDDQCSDTSSSR